MNKEESLALFARGMQAWNVWAAERLAERERLEAAGEWSAGRGSSEWNDATRDWLMSAVVDFFQHKFEDYANFTGFIFPGDAGFDEAIFSGNAGFGGAKFSGDAGFREARFLVNARFDLANFSGDAGFRKASFSGDAWFRKASFSGDAGFDEASFLGDAWFHGASFSGNAAFGGASFSGNAAFGGASFSGNAFFDQSAFEGFTTFDNADFGKAVSFRAMDGRSTFSLAGVTFRAVPDLTQAHFAEAPRLDDLHIEPGGFEPFTLARVKADFKGDPDLSARWRALKWLALQGHDHEREQAFFKGELMSRRWCTDKPWHAAFWFGLVYQWLSDFGRSMVRPLLWWGAGVIGFACLYLGQHLFLAGKSLSGFGWAVKWPSALVGSKAPLLSCMAGPGDPWSAALGLSLRNGLLFVGLGPSEKFNQIYGCLYGIYTATAAAPGQLSARFLPVIPDGIAFLGLVQVLYSAVLIFLFLLAVRNHFRIKRRRAAHTVEGLDPVARG